MIATFKSGGNEPCGSSSAVAGESSIEPALSRLGLRALYGGRILHVSKAVDDPVVLPFQNGHKRANHSLTSMNVAHHPENSELLDLSPAAAVTTRIDAELMLILQKAGTKR